MTLKIENASFSYEKKNILSNVSLTAGEGELVAILGPNGAGKTTLLRCMLGFLKWNEGKSTLDGTDIRAIPQKKLWSSIAYVPQARSFTSAMTVLTAVLLGRTSKISFYRQPTEEDVSEAVKILERLGIAHLESKRCNEISGGELQMVLIARALASKPKILVLDEPESNLDFKNQLIVLNTLSELSTEGVTCIFNTHYPAHALTRCDKALLLFKNGESIFGDTASVVTEQNIERAFGVKAVIGEVDTDENTLKSITALKLSDGEKLKDMSEERIAILSIIASDFTQGERISELLHSYSKYLIGRMGMPYKKAGVNIINVTLEAPYSEIDTLLSKLSLINGVSVKATYAKTEGSF